MQLAAAGDLEGLRGIGILDAQRDIGVELSVETVADVAAGDIFAVLARQRGIIDIEGHCNGGLGNLLERDGHGILGRAEGIADVQIIDSRYGNDGSDAGLLYLDAAQSLKLIELADLDLAAHIGIVMVHDHTLLVDADGSVVHLAHADASDIFIVVDGADQHLRARFRVSLRCRDIIDDGLKERLHAGAGAAQIHCRNTGLCGCKDKGAVDLLVAGAQIHQQFQDLVDDLGGTRTGAVDLVDADNDRQIKGHGLAQDKAGLRHGTLESVHDQDDSVDHLENALHLSAEICVSGSIHDIDLCSFVIDCSVFAEDRDPALALQIVGVHDALLHRLILTEHTALLEQSVHQRSLAVIDMGDDCYISDVFSLLLHIFLS